MNNITFKTYQNKPNREPQIQCIINLCNSIGMYEGLKFLNDSRLESKIRISILSCIPYLNNFKKSHLVRKYVKYGIQYVREGNIK